ncbi:MAG: HlyD family efflux transporter periplasmic adaptor subunit [Rubrivivax sp.]|jgi:HlyD family secretion protein|nr:HlyD family efflux transporter periplasmic adaptor subunit [Rubrivivax sp.]
MKPRTWITAALGTVALGAALVWAFAPRPLPVETAPAVRGHFETVVDEEGKTLLADRYVVTAPLAGQLARMTLKEGDSVDAGAAVAMLAPVMPAMLDERSRRELQARAQVAEAGAQRAATRIARAEVGLEQAQMELRRAEPLSQQGFIAPTRLDSNRLAVRAAEEELASARADRHMATHEIEQARAALSATRGASGAGHGGLVLRAPVAGHVLRVLQASEGTVAIGTPLLELGDTGRLEVVAELLTSDALAVQPGSRVTIERWGGPSVLQGRVLRIEPGAFTKVSALGVEEQRVRVHIGITSPHAQWQRLGDGYRVSVRIVVLEREHALQVPASAVFPLPAAARVTLPAAAASSASAVAAAEGPAQHAVFVADGGRARQVAVEVLARNASMAWIRDGLEPGTALVLYPPSALRDGQRIQHRQP